MSAPIDTTDFAILERIQRHDKPLWKNKIHECIVEQADELPMDSHVSVQTVGRRVDTLAEDGYLENAIISPDEIKRDLIIAYKLTEQGKDAIREKREELLRETVRKQLFDPGADLPVSHPALIELVDNKFDLDAEAKETLRTECGSAEIAALLGMYYTERAAEDVLESGVDVLQEVFPDGGTVDIFVDQTLS